MTKKSKRIADTVKMMRLENEKSFTYAQLQKIATASRTQVIEVMHYLRYER